MVKGWGDTAKFKPLTYVPADVVQALTDLGVEVIRQSGDEILGRCPGHLRLTGSPDVHPSWSVNINSGVHNCFSCGFKGAFSLIVQEVLGVKEPEAVGWIQHRASGAKQVEKYLTGGQYIDELEVVVSESDLALFTEPPPDMLEARGLNKFMVNYYGIQWESQRKLWITPVRDPYTNVLVGWQEKGTTGRYFKNYPKGLEKGKYLFGYHQSLDPLIREFPLLLVESPLDVPKIARTSLMVNPVSSFGTKVTDEQIKLLIEHPSNHVIIAMDNDKAGIKSATLIGERLRGRVKVEYFDYAGSTAKDPGDMNHYQIYRGVTTALQSWEWPHHDDLPSSTLSRRRS